MKANRPYSATIKKLRAANLRPTRQRLALARLLYGDGDRHVTAESLHTEAMKQHVQVSLATVYNTLHQFTRVGLLREVVVDSARSYFDTNTTHHHHFYCEKNHRLEDIPADELSWASLPAPPHGAQINQVDVVIRICPRES